MGKKRDDAVAERLESLTELVSGLARTVDVVLRDQQALSQRLNGIYDRLGGIEWRMGERLDPLVHHLAGVQGRLEQLADRDDVRRGVDRVLGAVSSAEQSVAGEVRAVEARLGSLAEDVRSVRVLREGLDALAGDIAGVRQFAQRTATSQQMAEVIRELGAVLAEIEAARAHVLQIRTSSGPAGQDVVTVGGDVDDLGRRIDHLAEVVEERLAAATPNQPDRDASQQVAAGLRRMGGVARRLGRVTEDVRAGRGRGR